MNRISQFGLVLLISVMLFPISCIRGGDENSENDPYNYIATVGSQEISFSGNEFEARTDNCGASLTAKETLSRSRSFDIRLEADVATSLGGEFEGDVLVAGAKVQAAIETTLGIQIGTTETVNAERELETPADSISIITLQWEEIWDTGKVNIIDNEGKLEREIPFRVLTTLRLSQKSVDEIPCTIETPTVSIKETNTQTPPTPVPTTAIPSPTSIPPTNTPVPPTPTQILPSPTSPPPPSNQTGYSRGNPPVPAPLGWAYEQDNVQLNLIKAEIRTDADSQAAAAYLYFALLNKSSQEILVEFDHSKLYIIDALGQKYGDWDGPEIETFQLEPNEFEIIARYYSIIPGEKSRIPTSALPITVYADELSRVQNAQWVVGSSPIPTYVSGDPVGQLGDALSVDDFDVTLVDLEIRTTSDSQAAAFRAWFSARNKSTLRQLLVVDYAYIYIEDNFGNRYIDWDGAGIVSTWVDPGDEFKFSRYYSAEYEEKSRVPISTTYTVVVIEGIASGTRAQWRIDIVR